MASYIDYDLSKKEDVDKLQLNHRMKGSILVTLDDNGDRRVSFRFYGADKEAEKKELLTREPVHETAHGKLYRLSSCWKALFRFPHGQMTAVEMGDQLSEEADIMSDYVVEHATV